MRVVFLLVILALFAVATAMVADRKGRNPALWAVLGFFFGLIALIAAALMPRRGAAPQ